MDIEEFDDCVDRLGEDPTLWPSPAREQGLALLRDEPAARAIVSQAKLLRTALSSVPPARAPAGLADRIVQKAVAARAPAAPIVPARGAWLSRMLADLFASPRPAVILPLCFILGIALGWLPAAFQADALRLDVPVLLTGMVE
jgi:hypothetical protein